MEELKMIKLNVVNILQKQNKSKYWLFNQLNDVGTISYTNFDNLVENKTKSIRYEYIDKLSKILNVPINELFIEIDK